MELTTSKETWIGWFSSLMEAYNSAIYSFTAPFLASLVFKEASSWKALFFSYGLAYIGSTLFYPLGAFYYGFLGDKSGRQKTCTHSTLGLAIATGLIGILPFHFLILLLLLSLQHFFAGGEYHGSIVFSLEHSKGFKESLMSGICCLFAVFGLLLANGLSLFAASHSLIVRGCFLLGAFGGVIGFLLKNHCRESPVFHPPSIDAWKKTHWFSFIKKRWAPILGVLFILAFFIVIYSFIFVALPLLFSEQHPLTFDTFKSLLIYGLALLFAGYLGDLIGRDRVMIFGLVLSLVFLSLLFFVCKNLFTIQLCLTVSASLFIGPMHSWNLQHFAVEERCRGIFIGSALAISIFGGTTVPICLMLFEHFHSLFICGLYPIVFACFALTYLFIYNYENIRSSLAKN